jgi:hypothetical protein
VLHSRANLGSTLIQTTSIIWFEKTDVSRASAVFNAGRQNIDSLGIALSSLLIVYGFKSKGIDISHPITNPSKAVFYYSFMLIPFVAFLGILVTLKINNKKIIALISKTNDKEF